MPVTVIKQEDKTIHVQRGMKGKAKPKVYPLICDRLTLTCNFPSEIQSSIIHNFKQDGAKKKHYYDLSLYLNDLEKSFLPYVEDPGYGETAAYVQCSPNAKDVPFFRIQFNPAKLASIDELRAKVDMAWLTKPGFGFDYVLDKGTIAAVDFAVDIADERVNSFLFQYPQIQCCEVVHSKSGRTEYLGTNKGGTKRFRIYDRIPALKQHNSKHWKNVEKEPIPNFDVMRVEVTLHPKCRLKQFLHVHGNPFNRLAVAAFSSVKPMPDFSPLEQSLWDMFLSLARFEGAQAALARLPKMQRAKFRKQLEKGNAAWWKPEIFWNQAPDIVGELFNSYGKPDPGS